MNDYEVKLLPSAEDDLAAIWVASPNPLAVTQADAVADQMLRRDHWETEHSSPKVCTDSRSPR